LLFGVSNDIILPEDLFRFLFEFIEGDIRFLVFSPSISAVVTDDKKSR
jgi:hypothetical protein